MYEVGEADGQAYIAMELAEWARYIAPETSTCIETSRVKVLPASLHVSYLIPITIESGPASGSTRVSEKPAAVIHPAQSAPV